MEKDYDYFFKISVVGDPGIGKTAFIETFAPESYFKKESLKKSFFQERVVKRIGVNFYEETIVLNTDYGSKKCKIRIWDTAGRKSFESIRPQFYRGSKGAILFFDLANRDSFININKWIVEVREGLMRDERRREKKGMGKIPILLVGNKSDLETFRVSPKEIDQFIRDHNLYYIETSTVTKEGIIDCFYSITSLMLGVDIHSEYFLSNDIIYRPNRNPESHTSSTPTLSAKDLRNLSQKAIFQKLDILEKKLDSFKTQEIAFSKQMELEERKLKLKEKELQIKEIQLNEKLQAEDLGVLDKKIVVFVSYATKDKDLFKIKEFAEILTTYEKVDDVLYWEEDLKDNIVKYMSDNLDKCDILLLFCSPHALKSKAIEKEWTSADIMNKPIIPIFIKLNHIPPLLKSRLGIEFDTFDLQKTIDEVYNLIIKKMENRLIDIKDLKTDF